MRSTRISEALFGIENVILQPHLGSATEHTRSSMRDDAIANLAAGIKGLPPFTAAISARAKVPHLIGIKDWK